MPAVVGTAKRGILLFLVFAGCGLVAAFAGIALRKKKNAKEEVLNGEISESEA